MKTGRPFCKLRNDGGVVLLAARHCGRCPVVVRKCNTNTNIATTKIFTSVVDVTGIWFDKRLAVSDYYTLLRLIYWLSVIRYRLSVGGVGRVVVLNSNVTS